MDNTAPGSSVGEITQTKGSTAPTEPVQQQQQQSQQGSAPVQQEPVQQAQPVQQSVPPVQQQHAAVRPMEPPSHAATVAPRRESGPVATMPTAEVDEQPVVVQEAPVAMQPSHPEVVMPKEVESAGVVPGEDAKKEQLPEVKQTLTEAGDIQQPVIMPVQPGSNIKFDMSLEEAKQAAKKTKSIKSGLAWIIREIIRQLKKKDVKDDE